MNKPSSLSHNNKKPPPPHANHPSRRTSTPPLDQGFTLNPAEARVSTQPHQTTYQHSCQSATAQTIPAPAPQTPALATASATSNPPASRTTTAMHANATLNGVVQHAKRWISVRNSSLLEPSVFSPFWLWVVALACCSALDRRSYRVLSVRVSAR